MTHKDSLLLCAPCTLCFSQGYSLAFLRMPFEDMPPTLHMTLQAPIPCYTLPTISALLKFLVSFAKEPYKHRSLLQKELEKKKRVSQLLPPLAAKSTLRCTDTAMHRQNTIFMDWARRCGSRALMVSTSIFSDAIRVKSERPWMTLRVFSYVKES